MKKADSLSNVVTADAAVFAQYGGKEVGPDSIQFKVLYSQNHLIGHSC